MHPEMPHTTDYERALLEIMQKGERRGDRTGTGTLSLFGLRMEFDLQKSFPLITTKRVFFKGVIEELLWFMRGERNIHSLKRAGVNIWDEWANDFGDVGPIYGHQWRSWPATREKVWKHGSCTITENPIDQMMDVINQIKGNPESRRLLVSAWNVSEIPDMALPPCHVLFQFYVREGRFLDCQLYQRSGDMFLGVPFNIASYAALTHMLAQITGLEPGRFIHVIGDAHIYLNHIEQVEEQLSREPRPLPTLHLRDRTQMDPADYEFEDFELEGYDPHPAIKGEVAI